MSEEKEECIYFIYTRFPNSTLSRRNGERGFVRKVRVPRQVWEEVWLNYWTSVQNRRARDRGDRYCRDDSLIVS